jgi:hypothetical protein
MNVSSNRSFSGALEAIVGSSKWQFSVVAGSNTEIYQFSRVTFLDKFPLIYLETLKNGCEDTFRFMQDRFESSLRCSLRVGWQPISFHSLLDCKLLVRDDSNRMLENLHATLQEKLMQHIIRRQNSTSV